VTVNTAEEARVAVPLAPGVGVTVRCADPTVAATAFVTGVTVASAVACFVTDPEATGTGALDVAALEALMARPTAFWLVAAVVLAVAVSTTGAGVTPGVRLMTVEAVAALATAACANDIGAITVSAVD
jgi:hypothetical protein